MICRTEEQRWCFLEVFAVSQSIPIQPSHSAHTRSGAMDPIGVQHTNNFHTHSKT